MSRFAFRLQRVLDLHQRREDEALARLNAARAVLDEAERASEVIAQRINQHIATGTQRTGALDPARLTREISYLERLKHELRLAEENRQAAQRVVEERRAAAVACARDRRSLELLRDRQAQAFATEMRRAEQKADDEVAQRGRGMGQAE